MKGLAEKIKEYRYLLFIAVIALVFTAALTAVREPAATKEGVFKNEAGQGERTVSFQIKVPGLMEKEEYTLVVPERTLSEKEQNALFQRAEQELETVLCGESASVEEIKGSTLSLPEYLADGQISVSYEFEPEEYIDEEGNILWQEIHAKTMQIQMKATLFYGQESKIYKLDLKIEKPPLSRKEEFRQQLETYFAEAFEKDAEGETVKLPESMNGYTISWKEKTSTDYQTLWLLCGLAAVALTVAKWEEGKRRERKWKQELLRQYPDMVEQLALLLSAGMTVYGAWKKMVLQYRTEKQAGHASAVYEEMLRTYYEIHDGVSESVAYERFAARCSLPPYRRLCGLLVQNLKKGSAGIREQLQQEVQEALEEKKSSARKRGEEAGTKLLLPMMIMLFVVLVIVLVPVLMSI